MRKVSQVYMIGEAVKGCYERIAHCENGILWWVFRGKFRKHTSKATMQDFHSYLVQEIDKVYADSVFRGRCTADKGGIATILPPVKVYSKPIVRLPKKILDMVYANLKPAIVLVDTPTGLHKVIKGDMR